MIRFVGDVSLTDGYFDSGFGLGTRISNGLDPFSRIPKGDFWIGNFEGVASTQSKNKGNRASFFRIAPHSLAHCIPFFSILGVANNHVMQHGEKAYAETINTIERLGVPTIGSNEKRTHCFSCHGAQFSITGFSLRIDEFSKSPLYWHNPELKDIIAEIETLPVETYKIAFIHWGYEYADRPSVEQMKFAHLLIDSGYDLIIGMHPHVLQGFEVYKSKFIFYSLGNFTFDMPWEPTKYGAIVNLDPENGFSVSYDYICLTDDDIPQIVPESQVPAPYRFTSLNFCLHQTENDEQYFQHVLQNYKKYRRANHLDIAKKMLSHPSVCSSVVSDFIKRRIFKKYDTSHDE